MVIAIYYKCIAELLRCYHDDNTNIFAVSMIKRGFVESVDVNGCLWEYVKAVSISNGGPSTATNDSEAAPQQHLVE